jgi:hypothetical protein
MVTTTLILNRVSLMFSIPFPQEVFIMGSGSADLSLQPLLTGNEFSVN